MFANPIESKHKPKTYCKDSPTIDKSYFLFESTIVAHIIRISPLVKRIRTGVDQLSDQIIPRILPRIARPHRIIIISKKLILFFIKFSFIVH